MGVGLRLWWCLLFASAIICSARNTFSFSGNEMTEKMEGRSLKTITEDYNDPSANRGHDPRNKFGGSSGGRKSRDIP
ncbi:hypothetical protein HHK36_010721 [Tetracentron sinense]|uniref:Uncharacterized protein n=1 Tax=Tetracentron sinense TaxID=13715 RepID=A0A835DJ87_TETSI|nr:hypothetical protein HHK36_010721 [Tetracentron sinense]